MTETSTQRQWCPCCEEWIDVPSSTEHAFEDEEGEATSVLDDARFMDSPCGPVLAPGEPLPMGEHCDCCSHRRIGDHAGPVCPCENGWTS